MSENEYHVIKDPDFPRSEYEARSKNARSLMELQNLDALLILEETDLTYFSGYRKILPFGSKSRTYMLHFFILPKDDDPVLVLPLEMRGNAECMSWIDDLRFFQSEFPHLPRNDPIDLLLQTLDELKLTKGNIGCELGNGTRLDCSWSDFDNLRNGLPTANLIDAAPLIWELRAVKSSAEIEYLQKACDITQHALRTGFETIQRGMTEQELLTNLYKAALHAGAADMPLKVDFVVIAGPERHLMYDTRASGKKKINTGEGVIVDGGASYRGYWTDMTRMAFIGTPNAKQKEMFDTAHDALHDALTVIKTGASIRDIANAAAQSIRDRNYEEYSPFTSIGHGVGLEIHEPPFISPENTACLTTGNVLAIEPTIFAKASLRYMQEGVARGAGTGDFFVEDNIVVTTTGLRNLTPMEHELWVVS